MLRAEFHSETSPKKRAMTPLGRTLDRGLIAYAAAASAAGVSVIALSQPADAKIVYTRVNREIAPNTVLKLDLTHSGNNQFTFSNRIYTSTDGPYVDNLMISPSGNNGLLSSGAVLRSGVQVGPKGKFQKTKELMVSFFEFCTVTTSLPNCSTRVRGPWNNISQGYLGLKFYIRGQVHYGWARLNVTVTKNEGIYALLTGYAYESVANEPITTGKTKGIAGETVSNAGDPVSSPNSDSGQTTLGVLAQGASTLDVWRKRSAAEK